MYTGPCTGHCRPLPGYAVGSIPTYPKEGYLLIRGEREREKGKRSKGRPRHEDEEKDVVPTRDEEAETNDRWRRADVDDFILCQSKASALSLEHTLLSFYHKQWIYWVWRDLAAATAVRMNHHPPETVPRAMLGSCQSLIHR